MYSLNVSANRLIETNSDQDLENEVIKIQNMVEKEREIVEKMKTKDTSRIDVNIGCVKYYKGNLRKFRFNTYKRRYFQVVQKPNEGFKPSRYPKAGEVLEELKQIKA
jgi:hypothetical protein